MPYRLLIGFAAGLVSAVVFISAATGPVLMGMVLFLLTPLAMFLAGLGLGPLAAAVAGLAGAAFLLVTGSALGALVFAVSQAIPVVVLTYLASLNRQTDAGTVEWYPAGRLVIAAAILAGLFATFTIITMGGTDTLRETLRTTLDQFINIRLQSVPDAPKLSPDEIDEFASLMVAVFPAVVSIGTLITLLFNLWLAGRITMASGRLQRPWPDLAAIVYPPVTPLLLAVATGAGFLAGLPGLIAKGFAGPLFLTYVILGLAVVHFTTRGRPWRPFALWGLYASLFIMNTIALLAIALLGLAEAIWPMRKTSPPPKAPPPT